MIKAYRPLPLFPSISITGEWCGLKCKYCEGKFLKEMYPALSPKKLYELCRNLKKRHGILGCLISGGFMKNGKLPIKPYLPVIREIKRDLDLIISVHVGLADREYAKQLSDAKVDIVDLNVLDPFTMSDVMKLNSTWRDVERTLNSLYEYGPPYIAPHILIGAFYGKIKSEYKLLSLIKDYNPYVIIMLTLVQAKGTSFQFIEPPSIDDVVSIFNYARQIIPNAEIALGCMRPRGVYSEKLELKLLKQRLLDRIVIPSTFKPRYLPFCCSLPNNLEDVLISRIKPSYKSI
ncbi:MAG: radical SAM protein [archaeon GB-1867-035]|nr:radical SAM protein [Candidatus Culexmicrobium profundum]